MPRSLVMVALLAWIAPTAEAGEVRGRVEMPDACSPSVSPAVVTLDPVGGAIPAGSPSMASQVAVVNQHGLQFEPRVQVARVGRPIRFTNQDAETHNVHIVTPGFPFDRSMKPGEPVEFVPKQAGLIRLVCGVHSHMRGFVVVTGSPWAKVCKGGAGFKFSDVPDGRYILNAWHEMGEPLAREVEVKGGETLDLGTITLKGFPVVAGASAIAPVRGWPDVTDRIGVLLAEAREAMGKPGGKARAMKLAEDAYWGEFETSAMETAVRRHLGFQRAGAIESQFLGLRSAISAVDKGTMPAAELVTRSRKLLVDLARASGDLQTLNVHDRRGVDHAASQSEVVAIPAASERAGQLKALAASFDRIKGLADRGEAVEASSAMTDAYFTDFEPLERLLNVRRPQEITPLETRFNATRGRIGSGLKGSELASDLAGLQGEVVAALGRCESETAGSFGLAFFNSLVTILREGVEVILLLTMLIALVVKAGQPKGLVAIRWGIGLAVALSVVTAIGLNLLVASSQGRTREVMEGAVMMAAAGVLFYVSYWLISQTQAKRWTDFLKGRVAQGAKAGGLFTLGLTSFLAVYREGAETALLYQAMISGQGGSRDGLIGLATGLLVGLAILAAVAIALRRSSVKLPLRPFFQVTGFLLFAMAVVFAGNGVFELQGAGFIKTTAVGWLGSGLPALGIHPTTQSLSIQALLVVGGLLAFVAPGSPSGSKPTKPATQVREVAKVGA